MTSPVPAWTKLALLFGGAALILTAIGAIPADPARFRTPHWVVFAAGVAFVSAGGMSFLVAKPQAHPAGYHFLAGVLTTCMFLVSAGVAMYATGSAVTLGPFVLRGPAADAISRFAYWTGAAIVGLIAAAAWWAWLRATASGYARRRPPSSSARTPP